jgi:hypothetical protein
MAMTLGEQMPLAEVKNRLSEVVEQLEREHGRVVITKGAGVRDRWTAPARRALARLPEKAAAAAVEFVYGSLAANPHRVGKRS